MKKIISLILLLLLSFTLIGCTEEKDNDKDSNPGITDNDKDSEPVMTDAEKNAIIDKGITNLSIGFESGETLKTILSDITLPTTVDSDDDSLNVTWTSSNTSVISNTGTVTTSSTKNEDVVLTAKVAYSGLTKNKTFEAVVLKFDSTSVNPNYSRALNYFRNSGFNPTEALPSSITSSGAYQTANENLKCSGETGLDDDYDQDCFTNNTVVNTQSDSYEDMLELVETFSAIKTYSQMAEDIVTAQNGDIAEGKTVSVPSKGADFKVLNTAEGSQDSYTFATNVDANIMAVNVKLALQIKLSFDESLREFKAEYTFEIEAGIALFNLNIYELSAVVTTNDAFELKTLEIATSIPVIGSKMTKLIVNADDSVELFSYRNNLILSDYKSYIYADENYGVSYYWTSGSPLNPFSGEKSSFEVFTPNAKLYELNLKGGANADDEGAAKFYFSGIDGYDRLEVENPSLRWQFKIKIGDTILDHDNGEGWTGISKNNEFTIEREYAYEYKEKIEDGKFVGYERAQTLEDAYYVAVINGNLYELPTTLTTAGLSAKAINIENSIDSVKTRLTGLTIMNKSIFDTPGSETGTKITFTIPGLNKSITV